MRRWKYDKIVFVNRWKRRYGFGTSTIVGLAEYWAGPLEKCYKLCFFGLEIMVWLKAEIQK